MGQEIEKNILVVEGYGSIRKLYELATILNPSLIGRARVTAVSNYQEGLLKAQDPSTLIDAAIVSCLKYLQPGSLMSFSQRFAQERAGTPIFFNCPNCLLEEADVNFAVGASLVIPFADEFQPAEAIKEVLTQL